LGERPPLTANKHLEKLTMLWHLHQRSPTQRQIIIGVAFAFALASCQSALLLRSHDWLEDYGAHVGGSVYLDMPEMGVVGEAQVLAIEPCPPLEPGEGRIVTGTFRHTSGEVYDLMLESESQPIGVTATHPFWSVDRNGWVSAIDLDIGETLKTLEGTTVVESRSMREEPETVYNIEVEGDHCYRVGESGVLVHNASMISWGEYEDRVCADLGLTGGTLDITAANSFDGNVMEFDCGEKGVIYVEVKRWACNKRLDPEDYVQFDRHRAQAAKDETPYVIGIPPHVSDEVKQELRDALPGVTIKHDIDPF
jgi:hypothetical protein